MSERDETGEADGVRTQAAGSAALEKALRRLGAADDSKEAVPAGEAATEKVLDREADADLAADTEPEAEAGHDSQSDADVAEGAEGGPKPDEWDPGTLAAPRSAVVGDRDGGSGADEADESAAPPDAAAPHVAQPAIAVPEAHEATPAVVAAGGRRAALTLPVAVSAMLLALMILIGRRRR